MRTRKLRLDPRAGRAVLVPVTSLRAPRTSALVGALRDCRLPDSACGEEPLSVVEAETPGSR